ncbi:histidine phosphatase family protein [Coraliomargarita algicola]|uniref:Histidine phosphatase family protein n=1 Tax=Coraliomargarita algicola TaxID=3092156 RepID=A0ABZ0RJH6_9BACT|nr:histidine phosphatase family protein [Coraliomargarita sp. J2-16]WPJ96227.1 histidine phosphatase family protein [Coraliomargarita sp. J2-16]
MKAYIILSLALSLTLANVADAGLKIYYIRHAEGGHNVKKAWEAKGIPESEWPAYVGDPNAFTPKGLTQVVSATEKLQNYHFDFVATSPMWRVHNTIAPYLKLTGQKAEVWPELREGPGMVTILSEDIPEVHEDILNKGEAIVLTEEESAYLKLRPGAENNYSRYPRGSSENEKVAYMKHVSLHAIDLIEEQFGDSDKSILLAGHNSAGVSLLKLLLQEAPSGEARRGLDNTGIWMVERQEDGSYKLMLYNDKPYQE